MNSQEVVIMSMLCVRQWIISWCFAVGILMKNDLSGYSSFSECSSLLLVSFVVVLLSSSSSTFTHFVHAIVDNEADFINAAAKYKQPNANTSVILDVVL